MFRLPAEEAALRMWQECSRATANGSLGTMLGRPLDAVLGSSEAPILIYLQNPRDDAEVRSVIQGARAAGIASAYTVKTSDGALVNCAHCDCAPQATKQIAETVSELGKRVRSQSPLPPNVSVDIGDASSAEIDWASLLGGDGSRNGERNGERDGERDEANAANASKNRESHNGTDINVEAIDWSFLTGGTYGGTSGGTSGLLPQEPELKIALGESRRVSTPPEHHGITMQDVPKPTGDRSDRIDRGDGDTNNAFPMKMPHETPLTPRDFYAKFVARTPEECAAELAAPQRSAAWLRARSLAITASDFGAAAGHNAYNSPEELLERKLWDSFQGNDATAWGSYCEEFAGHAFSAWYKSAHPAAKRVVLHSENLMKSSSAPWMAVSPDGLLETQGEDGEVKMELVEFKCPVRDGGRDGGRSGHPYAKYAGNVPPYYMDQVQGIAGYLNSTMGGYRGILLSGIWFVVWRPTYMWVTRVMVDPSYYSGTLLPALQSFYFQKLLPAFAHKHNGVLKPGQIIPAEIVQCEGADSACDTKA